MKKKKCRETSRHWPVILIATAQAQPGFAFEDGMKFGSNRLDDISQVAERPGRS